MKQLVEINLCKVIGFVVKFIYCKKLTKLGDKVVFIIMSGKNYIIVQF